MRSFRSIFCLMGVFVPTALWAEDIVSMTNILMAGPMAILWQFLQVTCYIIGVVLLVIAAERYRRYRQNLQETTLSTPIIYALMGIIVLLIPLVYHLTGQYFG